jgi:NAD(P)H-dependent flavin oxidoreductase YrpB (nitropropane dioxygenase family)
MSAISTPITSLFNIQHPILLAGMNVAAGPELAAAVTNAGGLGVIGGVGYTPKVLRAQVSWFLLSFHTIFAVNYCTRHVLILRLSPLPLAETCLVRQIHELKKDLKDKNAPFGVDLLLPQVGGNARKTNVRLSLSLPLHYPLNLFKPVRLHEGSTASTSRCYHRGEGHSLRLRYWCSTERSS